MDLEGQVNKWKRKYENSEKNLATLKKLAHKGECLNVLGNLFVDFFWKSLLADSSGR